MTKRITPNWLTFLMTGCVVLAFGAASLGAEQKATPGNPNMVTVKLAKLDGTVVEKQVEKPKYGGEFKIGYPFAPRYFDDTFGHPIYATTMMHTNETLMQGDWARGPAGTGEASWLQYIIPPKELQAGCVAENWEITDDQTIVYHIRKGVLFHNKPPTNGREMTADDVVFSLKRLWEVKTSIFPQNPYVESITAPDKWTVVVKTSPGKLGVIYRYATWYGHIVPREVVEKYGNINDWENSCGTGPFILTHYESESAATFKKNPDYWQKDPLHPENRLPYLDTLKFLIIPDESTRLAGLRTGKVDWVTGVAWEQGASVTSTNPELKWLASASGTGTAICWRVDKPELPYHDLRVRRALTMAVDKRAIVKEFYGGQADLLAFPCVRIPEFANYLPPLEELPASVQELYGYYPEKAKKLLAEAGYAKGFRASIVCSNEQVDLLSIVKHYWSQVGVELDLQVKESAAYVSLGANKNYDAFMASLSTMVPDQYAYLRVGNVNNHSMVNDPRIEDAYAQVTANYFNEAARAKIMRENFPYALDQAYLLQLPGTQTYTFWQPWVSNYSGERYVGVWGAQYNFVNWIWVDRQT